jgi:hypothetical protein
VLLLLLSAAASLAAAGEPALFSRYIANLKARQPESWIARLDGSAVTARLASVPPDAVTKGKRPLVHVYHKRYAGQSILVDNVDTVFRKMFSLYNNYINLTGMYIFSKGETWAEFSKAYELSITATTATAHVLRIRAKNQDPESYGLFTLSRQDLMVRSASFYNRGSLIYAVTMGYRRLGRYLLPDVMDITRIQNGVRHKPARLVFSAYRINVPIPSSVF